MLLDFDILTEYNRGGRMCSIASIRSNMIRCMGAGVRV
jgi:hypothetical protein